MDKIIIERAKPEDAEAIFNVQRQTWLDTYPNKVAGITVNDIRLRLDGENGELIQKNIERWRDNMKENAIFVAKVNNNVVGFAGTYIRDGQRRIGSLYILPEFQDTGIGGKLLNEAVLWFGRSENIYLDVASYNHKAINFYKKFGFENTGEKVTDYVVQFDSGSKLPEDKMVLSAKF